MPLSTARHGSAASSGADSWKSDDTIKANFSERKTSPFKAPPGSKHRNNVSEDSELSPRTRLPSNATPSKNNVVAPWDDPGTPSLSEPQPTGIGRVPSSVEAFPSLSSEKSPGLSPTSTHPDGGGNGYFGDYRRPSVASATTVSSSGSNISQSKPIHKKLQDFFGEDTSESGNSGYLTPGPKNDTSKPSFGRQPSYTLSQTVTGSSPEASRPRTPQPSSEVTPWMYQDPDDINNFGEAPLHDDPTDKSSMSTKNSQSHSHHHHHRLPFHRHRHQKSKDEPKQQSQGGGETDSVRSGVGMSRQPSAAPSWAEPIPSSPDQSSNGTSHNKDQDTSKSSHEHGGKRSIFDKLMNRKKEDRVNSDPIQPSGSSTSLNQTLTRQDSQHRQTKQNTLSRVLTGSEETAPSQGITPRSTVPLATPKKEHHSRLPFKSKRGTSNELPTPKDPNTVGNDTKQHESLWNLDTDLSQMDDIIRADSKVPGTPSGNVKSAGILGEDNNQDTQDSVDSAGAWDAPDSWAVKRAGDPGLAAANEEDTSPKAEDPGVPFCIRVFRPDGSFAILSVPLNTTSGEIVQILGKKTFLQEDIANYHLIMKKQGTSRQLEPGERPIVLQKKLLEQAGYNSSDQIEELGREDHSYLCRFTFMPAKMSGYSSLDKDPGFNKTQKLSNVDLQGRNLITIPIVLYSKASEIVFLNLSRNLSLDVPKDFVQSCTSLREIKYTGNEATRLPPSFSLAHKLTVLDISNNRLEQLDHAELNKLEHLASLKLSNNMLTALPTYFSTFEGLRSLNLSSNNLTELPEAVCSIKCLVDLDISFNSISTLPHISELVNLERLLATNNQLSGKPGDAVVNLRNLREIDIRFNRAENIDILSQLPQLEQLMAGHNSLTSFEGSFAKIRTLYLDHNPLTRFGLTTSIPTLSTLSVASGKLSQLTDDLFQKMSGLTKLIMDKNHFVSLPSQFGKLAKLESLSIAKNLISTLPPEIGRLSELRFLDAHENNIYQLPPEIWLCRKLETLNVSSNVLDAFPKPPTQIPALGSDQNSSSNGTGSPSFVPATPTIEEGDQLSDYASRRMSQASGNLSNGSSPAASLRKGSTASMVAGNRKPSLLSRNSTDGNISPVSRKDSILMNRINSTFAGSLRNLFLADNRLSNEVFDQLSMLQELRMINLSYNELFDIPPRTLRKWQYLSELYLSGNDFTALPSEDLEEINALKVLHINGNRFQVLPAELGKVPKLAILDVASNNLKYNVSNWPYDWNWNCNPDLRYLNLSANKRLEIKPSNSLSNRANQNLTDFGALSKLRILGLMDVTLMIPSVPETTEDRRVRTSGSQVGSMAYGIADCLGRNEHLSSMDVIVPRLEGHDDETLIGFFDGVPVGGGGSKVVKFLQENFEAVLKDELRRKDPNETAAEALRRTYLALDKQLATIASQSTEARERRGASKNLQAFSATQTLTPEDLNTGCVATVLYLHGTKLFVSNVGDAEAILIKAEGRHEVLTVKHDPASPDERLRIREAGGYVSRQGKLNDQLGVSRAFGFINTMPSLIASPHVAEVDIGDSDEIILLASRELWDYLTPDFAVDLARSERSDLMRAAQKLRDLAIAFGASGKITVMMIGVSDLQKKERARYRSHSMSMGPSGMPTEDYANARSRKRRGDTTLDSKLARLDQEVEAPTGEVSLAFTDIKNSTLLWETYPMAMRSAIKMHNEVMRRQLRSIGGYEVKTEGDAFMVAFPTVTSALLWCFTIQSQLLEVPWPQEILNSVNGQEVTDVDGNVLFRGLSVRMGIHFGTPVCEPDPVTRRMDYFGPMVNRAARISAVADGGQITVSSDFIAEVQRLLETHHETDRSSSISSDESMNDDVLTMSIRRELRSLSSHGFEVKDLGEKRLKGLENPEYIYLMYPHSLAGRLAIQQQRTEGDKPAEAAGAKVQESQLTIDLNNLWDLWNVSLRLEMLCSTLESPDSSQLKPPETALLEKTKERGGEVTDIFLINFVEHQISRIETCITTLALRNLVRPFRAGMLDQACPMSDIFSELSEQLDELRAWKEQNDIELAPS